MLYSPTTAGKVAESGDQDVADSSLIGEISRKHLQELLGRVADTSIGVVGDLALDTYWYADMTRSFLSRETPHFPRPVVRETYSPGAGANVADNLQAQGVGHVGVFSVLGADWRGSVLQQTMSQRRIDVDRLVIHPKRVTTAYAKPILMGYESQQEAARLDFENTVPLDSEMEDALIQQVSDEIQDLDALIVADQLEVNGVITDRVRQMLNEIARVHPDTVFLVDSRQRIDRFRHMALKPNRMEALVASGTGETDADIDHLKQIGKDLSTRSGRPTFITLSEQGVLVCTDVDQCHLPSAPVRPPIDPVGAGDTFIATLAAMSAAGATAKEAAATAAMAAAVVLEKLNQTGTASQEEILSRYDLILESQS
jgi:rfaE bifunctional protein kinase chain/domain